MFTCVYDGAGFARDIDTPPNFLHVLADVAAQQAYILSPQLQYPAPNEAQDTYVHLQFKEVVDRVPLADIPVENLPPAVVEAPVAVVPSPAPPTPVLQELPLPVVPLYAEHELFPHLCVTVDKSPREEEGSKDKDEKEEDDGKVCRL